MKNRNLTRRKFIAQSSKAAALGALSPLIKQSALGAASNGKPYNILFIIIDDHGPNLHSVLNNTRVHTPNMERLAARSTWFSHGYVASPGCCPSRTAFLTGVHAARSGVHYNNQGYRRASTWISGVDILPQHFMKNGYLAAGYGKILHNRFLEDDIDSFSPGYYKMFNREESVTYTETELLKRVIPGTLTEIPDGPSNYTWGILPDEWDRDDPSKMQQDTEQANRTIDLLKQNHDTPFFATCGLWRPHVSWTVAERYYERYPLENIEIPEGYRPDDLEDMPKPARWLATHRGIHDKIVKSALWKKALQAYYATVTYVDEQIGRILDALDASPYRDNTIVVFAADNGWHTGEKNHWSKFILTELACKVTFSISVPGMKPQVCETPVSLLDIYPTLIGLCGLPQPATHELDGRDLTPILNGSTNDRGAPVVSTHGVNCHSVRGRRFRYTRYRNGDEELYDHNNDPHEWHNLAGDPRYDRIKASLSQHFPKVNAPNIAFATGDVTEMGYHPEAFD